jgi:hypothetical protein
MVPTKKETPRIVRRSEAVAGEGDRREAGFMKKINGGRRRPTSGSKL